MTTTTKNSFANSQDETLAKWIATSPSVLQKLATVTPLQTRLGISKSIILMANLALDFKPFPDKLGKDQQNRFARLQIYYRNCQQCRSSNGNDDETNGTLTKNDLPPVLHLSPRMQIDNEMQREKLKDVCVDYLERCTERARGALEDLLLQEEETCRRREEKKQRLRRERSMKKKNQKGDNQCSNLESENDPSSEQATLYACNNENGDTSDFSQCSSMIDQGSGDQQHVGTEEGSYVLKEKKERKKMSFDKEGITKYHKKEKKNGSNNDDNSYAEDSFNKPVTCSIHEMARKQSIGNFQDDSVNDKMSEAGPRQLAEKQSKPPVFSNNNVNSTMSYLEAATSLIASEKEKQEMNMRAQRTEHIEMIQKVQLKAYIAETKASVAVERLENLEGLFHDILQLILHQKDANGNELFSDTKEKLKERIIQSIQKM